MFRHIGNLPQIDKGKVVTKWIFIYFHFIFDSYQSFFSQLINQNIFYLSLYIKSPTNGKLYVKRCFRLILF